MAIEIHKIYKRKKSDRDIFQELMPFKIKEILLIANYYDAYTIERAVSIAEEYKLLQSGGSDFHGENKPNIQLGCGKGNLEIPMMFYENLRKRQGKLV